MAMHKLLLRGMLVGLVAGLFAFGFARLIGEPLVDRAIAFESAQDAAKGEAPEPELVSRATQAGLGLLTGAIVYATALGGLFSIVFALSYGRAWRAGPRAFAAVLALLCFLAVYGVPFLKYPANPPAIGEPATIGARTALYFSLIALSAVAMVVAVSLRKLLLARWGGWNATLAGAATFLVLAVVSMALLPAVDEVPATFPADTLWRFRLADIGMQALVWATIGLGFGAITQQRLVKDAPSKSL